MNKTKKEFGLLQSYQGLLQHNYHSIHLRFWAYTASFRLWSEQMGADLAQLNALSLSACVTCNLLPAFAACWAC